MEEETDVWVFTASGHYNGCWGQCLDELTPAIPYIVPKEDAPILKRIIEIWKVYHLNDLTSGTKRQMDCLKEFVYDRTLQDSHYAQECNFLQEHGLLIDGDYKFGSKWLYMPIPDDIVAELKDIIK